MSNLKAALIQLQCEFVAERNRVNPNGLSWLQYDILHLLQQKGPASPSQLSEKLQIRPSKFSKAVKELKEKHYVTQTISEEDGRGLRTQISNTGLAFLDSVDAGHSALYETAIEHFSPEEQRCFTELANKLSFALEQERTRKE